MDNLLLVFCSCLSCFIVVEILFQFMNDRYKRAYNNKYVYYITEIVTIAVISFINYFDIWALNLAAWVIIVLITSYALYFDESNGSVRCIIECEVLVLCIAVCEAFGLALIDWILSIIGIDLRNSVMRQCLEITFSKVVVIFIYYMLISRLINKSKAKVTKVQLIISMIILLYSLVNIIVIAEAILNNQNPPILAINMGCIVLADLYLLYYVKVADNNSFLEGEIKLLEKQAKMQYEYYLSQERKYNATINILHDVNKHITSIEKIYASGQAEVATDYVGEIKDMLEPLIPVKYTRNPILDILLADKAALCKEKNIEFEINVDNINLDYIEAIDVTTIFGNLIDNAIEATERYDGDRFIHIRISPYQEMVLIRIENTSLPLIWKNGSPVSQKGSNHGIGLLNVKRSIEKYDGDITFSQDENVVTVELLLNS